MEKNEGIGGESRDASWIRSRVLREIWDVVKLIVVAGVVVLPIRYFVAQPFVVRGASMEPNFHNREYLVVDEISYYFRPPARGEAVIFRYPRNTSEFFIKRIVGLPGERVEVRDGEISIINEAFSAGGVLQEFYLGPPDRPTYPDVTATLGEGEYFVLGDNRDFSSDSRMWGTLARKFIVGRAAFRMWPVRRFGFIPREYPLLSAARPTGSDFK